MFDDLPTGWKSGVIIGLLMVNCAYQNAIYYYFIYIYFIDTPQSFAIAALIVMIITKLIWHIGTIVSVYKYDSSICCDGGITLIATCFATLVFGEFGILFLYPLMYETSLSWKWLCIFIAHILLVSLPMTVIHFVYIIISKQFMVVSLISIILSMIAVGALAVHFAQSISWKITMYHVSCFIVDFLNFIVKTYFLINFVYHGIYNIDNNDKSFWNNNMIYYCSWIYFVKIFIIGPLYSIWIFIFVCLEHWPSDWPLLSDWLSGNGCFPFGLCCKCIFAVIVYIIISLFLILSIWITSECFFCCYPFFIFLYFNDSYWKKYGNTNKWYYVMKYMNNSINSRDWRVRLYLINYLFWSTNTSNVAKFEKKGILNKIQYAMNWYINSDRDNSDNKQFEEIFDVTIFRHPFYDSEGILETVVTEYGYFLAELFDFLDNLFDIRTDSFVHFCNTPRQNQLFQCWGYSRECCGIFIILPLQLIASIYASFIYPMIIYIMYIIRNINNDRFLNKQNSEIFWIISIYWLFVVIMICFMISFVKFLYVWWHCLYRDYVGSIPCMEIAGFYEYIHSHRARINIIKIFFGPLANRMLEYLGFVNVHVININDDDNNNKETMTLQIDGDDKTVKDTLIEKEKQENKTGILPIPKDIRQILTDNNYIKNNWKYQDFQGYKTTVKHVQNNEITVDNWHHYLFE